MIPLKIQNPENTDPIKPEPEIQFNLEHFFQLTRDILCIAGYDGYIKKVNPAFSRLLGYTVEELMGRPISDFIYGEDKNITARFRESLKKDIPLLNFENRYVTKNGDLVWLSWTSVSEPVTEVIYAIAKDITHIKKLEEERNFLLKNLTKLNTDLKQFTYATSHDLRSPVNNLISLFSLLDLSKIKDSETLEYIELLNISALNMKNTLNKYVDAISRDEGINVNVEIVNLNDTLNITRDSIRTLIETSNASFEIDFSEVQELKFSSSYLQSIFLNLNSNSLKYSRPEADPVISITSGKRDNISQLIFTDNGMGFDMEEVKDKIFGLQQSFHNNHDSKGIGLYLVQSHMQSLGGTIAVESEVNIGTTFTLTFKDY